MSMAQYSNRQFGDPFIAKREMPGTKGEEENTRIYCIFQCYKWCADGIQTNYKFYSKNTDHYMCRT